MTSNLSHNEEIVIRLVFEKDDPEISKLAKLLTNKLYDKKGSIVPGIPDVRFVSKLKSTGLKKIYNSLFDVAKSLHLDIQDDSNNYRSKIKAFITGFNFMINTQTYLIYTLSEGVIVWYIHKSKTCSECRIGGKCENILETISQERSLTLPIELVNEETEKKAEWIFEKLKM